MAAAKGDKTLRNATANPALQREVQLAHYLIFES